MYNQDDMIEQSNELVRASHRLVLGSLAARAKDRECIQQTMDKIAASENLIHSTYSTISGYGTTRPRALAELRDAA